MTKTIEQVKGEIQRDIDILTASVATHREGGVGSPRSPALPLKSDRDWWRSGKRSRGFQGRRRKQ